MSQQDLYLHFLRFSLGTTPLPSNEELSEIEWKGLYDFAEKQALLGVMYQGISRLTADNPRPDRQQIFQWHTAAETIRDLNKHTNHAAALLTRKLWKTKGVKTCVLKGQGNALMYPDPLLRTPGDIDAWLNLKEEKCICLIRGMLPDAAANYHHIDAPSIQDVPVEVHYRPSFVENLFYNRRLQQFFEQQKELQFKNIVPLPGDTGAICVPADDFNIVFQLSHLQKHFFSEGVGLRQIIDLFYLLRHANLSQEERQQVCYTLRHVGLYSFATATMYVLHTVLGMPNEELLCPQDKRRGTLLLSEILEGGNFGYYDSRYNFTEMSTAKSVVMQLRRNLRMIRLFPAEALAHPFFILYWHFYYEPRQKRRVKEEQKRWFTLEKEENASE